MNENLVLLTDSHFIVDMMYARKNNMIGRAIYAEIGLGNVAYVHIDTLKALLSLVPELEKHNLKMRVCDAYRPPIAHRKMLDIIPYSKAKFFAKTPERSNHCHGTAVDVCLTDASGNNLLYPTEIDAYEEKYSKQVLQGDFAEFDRHLVCATHNYMGADKKAIENRMFLKNLMERHGFKSISHEWWHYDIVDSESYPLIDW